MVGNKQMGGGPPDSNPDKNQRPAYSTEWGGPTEYNNIYSLMRLVMPNTEELIFQLLEGLLKIWLLFQDGLRSPEFRN